jgi:gliding motility-associated-like protein
MLIAEGANILSTCRIASDPIRVVITPPAFVQATNYVFGCLGSEVPFYASGAARYEWTGPNGFTANIQGPSIKNVQFRDSGLYIVKGTTNTGCVGTASTYLQVFLNAKVTVVSPVTTCEGVPIQLSSTGGTKIKWDPGAGLDNDTIANPTFLNPRVDTSFKVIIFNQFGCFDTASVHIRVLKAPKADAGPDMKMLVGRPIRLKSSVQGSNVSFSWSPPTDMVNQSAQAPTVNPPVDTRYRLTVRSNDGCGTSSDETQVLVFEKIKVPNTFTPNGDGYNDVWQIDLLDLFENAITEVYNTAGQLVHRSVGYSNPWDGTRNGKRLPAGTYYYVIDLKTNADRLTGYVTIIR